MSIVCNSAKIIYFHKRGVIVLKKIIFPMLLFLIFINYSYANMYGDAIAHYTDNGDADKMSGFGFGLGLDMMPEVTFFIKSKYGVFSDYGGDIKNTNLTVLGIVEKNYQIKNYPVFGTIALGIGYSETNISRKYDTLPDVDASDRGVGYGGWLGIRYHLSQFVSPYFNIGYQKSYYQGDLENADIGGKQFNLGVTFTFRGKNRDLYSDY